MPKMSRPDLSSAMVFLESATFCLLSSMYLKAASTDSSPAYSNGAASVKTSLSSVTSLAKFSTILESLSLKFSLAFSSSTAVSSRSFSNWFHTIGRSSFI